MAFKMKGMSFGKGTGYKSPQAMKKEAAMRMKKEAAMKLKDPMDMKKDPMMMKKESPMNLSMRADFKKVKKPQTARAIARLGKKEKRLTKKMREEYVADTDSKKAARLSRRAENVADKRARKIKMAENIAKGKKGVIERRAGVKKSVDRGIVKTDKTFNKAGVKSNVARTNKVTGTTTVKKKSGSGVNKTVAKSIVKPKNVAKPKASTGPTFGQAFATARKAGKKTFTYKGKSYHTRTKEEDANYVKKSKGVAGPQTKAAQKYDDKGKPPFKLKKGAEAGAKAGKAVKKGGFIKDLKKAAKAGLAAGAAAGLGGAALGVAAGAKAGAKAGKTMKKK
jgi:hypothetical protein